MNNNIILTEDKPLVIEIEKRSRFRNNNNLSYDSPREYFYSFKIVDRANGNIIMESAICSLNTVSALLIELSSRVSEE